MTDAPERLLIAQNAGIVRVTLNRPEKRNAVDLQLCLELRAVFERIDADDTARVVLLEAAGAIFCAGADLSERKGKDEQWMRARRKASNAAYDAIAKCSKPVVALVHSGVIGSGGEIAMACDFIHAADDTYFRFPEPQWGTVGATQRLQRAIGLRGAKEFLFTGRKMPADEALVRGLVARVVPAAELAKTGIQVAESITAAPDLAIRLTKQAMDLGARTDLENGIRIEMSAIDQNLGSGDWRAGIARFTEKE